MFSEFIKIVFKDLKISICHQSSTQEASFNNTIPDILVTHWPIAQGDYIFDPFIGIYQVFTL